MNGRTHRELAERMRTEALSDLLWAEICGDADGIHHQSALLHGELAAAYDRWAAAAGV